MDNILYGDFMEQSKAALEKKSKLLKLAADSFSKSIKKIELGEQYKTGKICKRDFDEKVYYVKS